MERSFCQSEFLQRNVWESMERFPVHIRGSPRGVGDQGLWKATKCSQSTLSAGQTAISFEAYAADVMMS